MSSATQQQQTEQAGALVDKFSKKKRSIERCVWQDEKDFSVYVPFYAQNNRVYGMDKKIKFQVIGFFITQTNNPKGYGFCLCDMERCYKIFFCE